jgi:DNA invertase Pin-like site-specific DNA recombinase
MFRLTPTIRDIVPSGTHLEVPPIMPRIGYARVSTADQDLDTQLAKLKAEGCGIIRSEKVSGGSREGRTELATIIEFLRPGDELVVTRLDRLGRDTRDVLNIVHECDQRQAFVTVLDPHICTRGEAGRIVMTVLGMVAQMERRFIKRGYRAGQGSRRVPRRHAPGGPGKGDGHGGCRTWAYGYRQRARVLAHAGVPHRR